MQTFLCANGFCLSEYVPCNGINDCWDNSDEALCFCHVQEFQCSKGQCIAEYLHAVGSVTTEIDQTKISVICSNSSGSGGIFPGGGGSRGHPGGSGGYDACYYDEWKCLNGQCIKSIRQCDGEADCIDGSDEMQRPGGSFPGAKPGEINIGGGGGGGHGGFSCRPEEFTCEVNRQCTPKERLCDQFPDCPFQEEEKDCRIVQITGTCRMNEFECSSNVCIHASWVCDGRADCRDC